MDCGAFKTDTTTSTSEFCDYCGCAAVFHMVALCRRRVCAHPRCRMNCREYIADDTGYCTNCGCADAFHTIMTAVAISTANPATNITTSSTKSIPSSSNTATPE